MCKSTAFPVEGLVLMRGRYSQLFINECAASNEDPTTASAAS
jgi:hypothetical protein